VVHLTHVANGQKTERRLCEACAKAEGVMPNVAINWPMASLGQILGGLMPTPRPAETEAETMACGRCGWTLARLQQSGQVGCDSCYGTFGPILEPTLRRIHGAVEHRGKVPARVGGAIRAERELSQLRAALKEAVGREEFERAAALRDQIRQLEEQGGGSHG
jgi:protein arginine kinase activator